MGSNRYGWFTHVRILCLSLHYIFTFMPNHITKFFCAWCSFSCQNIYNSKSENSEGLCIHTLRLGSRFQSICVCCCRWCELNFHWTHIEYSAVIDFFFSFALATFFPLTISDRGDSWKKKEENFVICNFSLWIVIRCA